MCHVCRSCSCSPELGLEHIHKVLLGDAGVWLDAKLVTQPCHKVSILVL